MNVSDIVKIRDRSLSSARSELVESAPELGMKLGLSLTFLEADATSVVFLSENGIVTADYTLDENNISFGNISESSELDDEIRQNDISDLVNAIWTDDEDHAKEIFGKVAAVHAEHFMAREKIKEVSLHAEAVHPHRNRYVPDIVHSRNYFTRGNFPIAEGLGDLRRMLLIYAENSPMTDDETLSQLNRAPGKGKKPSDVKVSRKQHRIMKKFTNKNRARLLESLKKVRKKLKGVHKRTSYRSKVSRTKKLNDSVDMGGMSKVLTELAQDRDGMYMAYMTSQEATQVLRECFVKEGIDVEDEVIDELAKTLTMMARAYMPESRDHISEAASLFFDDNHDIPGNDIEEITENLNAMLWDAVLNEANEASDAIDNLSSIVDGLVDEIEKDFDEDADDPESKEISEVLEMLKKHQETLQSFKEDSDSIDNAKLISIFNDVYEVFGPEDEDEDETDGDNKNTDDDKSDDNSDDDNSDDDDIKKESSHLVEAKSAKVRFSDLLDSDDLVDDENIDDLHFAIIKDKDEDGDETLMVYAFDDSDNALYASSLSRLAQAPVFNEDDEVTKADGRTIELSDDMAEWIEDQYDNANDDSGDTDAKKPSAKKNDDKKKDESVSSVCSLPEPESGFVGTIVGGMTEADGNQRLVFSVDGDNSTHSMSLNIESIQDLLHEADIDDIPALEGIVVTYDNGKFLLEAKKKEKCVVCGENATWNVAGKMYCGKHMALQGKKGKGNKEAEDALTLGDSVGSDNEPVLLEAFDLVSIIDKLLDTPELKSEGLDNSTKDAIQEARDVLDEDAPTVDSIRDAVDGLLETVELDAPDSISDETVDTLRQIYETLRRPFNEGALSSDLKKKE